MANDQINRAASCSPDSTRDVAAAPVEFVVRRLEGQVMDAFAELNYRARIESLITEREGMIAENKQREQLGHSMAYPESEFMRIVREFEQIQLDLRSEN